MSAYKGRVRVRVSGILIEEDSILLLQIQSPVQDKRVWIPPGGGVEFGESLHQALIREFREETGLNVEPIELYFINELLENEFHAIEFFFKVSRISGSLSLGSDPELSESDQIIKDLSWKQLEELTTLDFAPSSLVPKLTKEYLKSSQVGINLFNEK